MYHPTLAEVKRLREDPDLQVKSVASPNVAYLAFNMSGQAPPYDNLHFRRAVALALDRTFLNRQVYFGLAVPAKNLVPPTLWADIGELDDYEHNLEKAKEELAKADLPDDFVAEVWHMNFARDYMPEPNKVAEFVKDQLARIGLKVRIQTFDKAAYSAKVKDKRHPMCLLGWMADYPDPDNFLKLLHGDFKNDLNISFFDDPEFNRLITDAASVSDWEKRKSLYLQAAKIYRDQVPSLALVHTQRVFAMRKNVKFRPHPIDYRIYRAHLSK